MKKNFFAGKKEKLMECLEMVSLGCLENSFFPVGLRIPVQKRTDGIALSWGHPQSASAKGGCHGHPHHKTAGF